MKIPNQIGKAFQGSAKLLQMYAKDYIDVSLQSNQLIVKPKAVLLLCQKATDRVEQLVNLVPDANEGLIAIIEHQQIKVEIHFTPEKIFFNGDLVEGQLRLLNKPKFKANSLMYRILISGWNVFLGGYIPNQVLPEGVRVDGDKVFYSLPKVQTRLMNALFQKLEDNSALNLFLNQGELRIESEVSINLRDISLQYLLQIFNVSCFH
ncbi:hypothetical protein [Altericista sp. CCNU0014]|uniref:hypothetical protein n=1 Tax=Altericista sp. CCNU0014 TaxID=3082949 RepID=UPI00384FF73C